MKGIFWQEDVHDVFTYVPLREYLGHNNSQDVLTFFMNGILGEQGWPGCLHVCFMNGTLGAQVSKKMSCHIFAIFVFSWI